MEAQMIKNDNNNLFQPCFVNLIHLNIHDFIKIRSYFHERKEEINYGRIDEEITEYFHFYYKVIHFL